MKKIAIEKGLSSISEYLKISGYKVSEFDVSTKEIMGFAKGFDAVVLSGMNKDLMGDETTSTKVPIIIASGLNPQDVRSRIETI